MVYYRFQQLSLKVTHTECSKIRAKVLQNGDNRETCSRMILNGCEKKLETEMLLVMLGMSPVNEAGNMLILYLLYFL